MQSTLSIEVHFDLICPWCLIGKRHLAQALDEFGRRHPDTRLAVTWRSYPLLPDTPLEGLPYQAFYVKRLGSPEAVAARRAQVREAGRRAGVEFNFDGIALLPNTLAAHELIAHVAMHGDAGQTEALIEDLFSAYFLRGEDIGDRSVLARIGSRHGVPEADLAPCLDAREGSGKYTEKRATDSRYMTGVPCFVIQDRLALSGAQPPEILLGAMEQAFLTP